MSARDATPPARTAAQSAQTVQAGQEEGSAAADNGRHAETGALTLRAAQALVDEWMSARGWSYWHPLAQLARMTEELGEVARVVNHLYGEKPKKADEAEQDLGLELADVLYTMICLANSQGIDLQQALERTLDKYRLRDAGRYPADGDSGLSVGNGAGAERARRNRLGRAPSAPPYA